MSFNDTDSVGDCPSKSLEANCAPLNITFNGNDLTKFAIDNSRSELTIRISYLLSFFSEGERKKEIRDVPIALLVISYYPKIKKINLLSPISPFSLDKTKKGFWCCHV